MNNRAYPEAFLAEARAILGDEFPAFRAALDEEAKKTLRVNPLRAGAEEAAREFVLKPVPWEPLGRYVRPDTRPGRSLAHECGAFYMQDASAMAPVAALNPQTGEKVLDLCAAPGGKSGQIAARLNGTGFLLANEIDFSRARALCGNLERLGVANAYVTSADSAALARALPGFFDAVLVDAPCSGEGMFRRDPDAIREWTAAAPAGCAARQRDILTHAARLVRPGGRLVYSTCTFNRAENEETIAAFLAEHGEFAPDDFQLIGVGASQNGCLRLWPHRVEGEGHFVARLVRCGNVASCPARDRAEKRRPAPHSPAPDSGRAVSLLSETAVARLPAGEAILEGENLRLSPLLAPPLAELRGVRVLRAGLPLARVGRDHVEPDHALAMALNPLSARRAVDLSDAEAALYLAGEALTCERPQGWTLVLWRGLPLGWGKVAGDTLKNHLPKGLRRRGGHAFAL